MGFAGVYTALYDYSPQGGNELQIEEGDLLYVLDNSSDDGWWKAKKKTSEVDAEEPVGLVAHNYVEEAQPIKTARSLYDYTRQTDEEVSFVEDADILVYDVSDPDWTLVNVSSEYGFAPANYIEIVDDIAAPNAADDRPPQLPSRNVDSESEGMPTPLSPASPTEAPAAALAGILHKNQTPVSDDRSRALPPPPVESPSMPPRNFTPQDSDNEETPAPGLPQRPSSHQYSRREQLSPRHDRAPRHQPRARSPYDPPRDEALGVQPSPPFNRMTMVDDVHHQPSALSASGYHLYNISEMISIMGKKKKMPTTLGINVAMGTIFISPEKSEDGPHQEWTADKLVHYSIEGKHVFLDLVRPTKNVDFHAGAKDTAQEIVSALGEISGGYKAEGLREVIAAGSGGSRRKGQILYDFMAQGDDEVTVAIGDDVIILDDRKSDEWWMVRRMRNGREGVVPSSYVEITGVVSPTETSLSGINAGLSTVEQNRLEEAQLAKNSSRKSRRHDSGSGDVIEVGPGLKLPERGSSRLMRNDGNQNSQRHKRDGKSSSKPKPDPSRTRKWTDRSGTFNVVAEFIALTDGKIHLHKQNGVKIAVPVSKMSIEDLEYVERATGVSLDEDKPLSDIKRRSQLSNNNNKGIGASVKTQPDYDWFDFFLKAGVGPHQCERYGQNFAKDSMDESVIPDITPEVLRTLGLKEGDIIRVTRYVDEKYGKDRLKPRNGNGNGEEQSGGGLFSGPGGALRNNTRKGRPVPPVQTSDVVDVKAFASKDEPSKSTAPSEATPPQTSSPAKDEDTPRGFEDNAWEVKTPSSTAAPPQPNKTQPALSGAMSDLSLLQTPLEPSTQAPVTQPTQPAQPTVSQPQQISQPQQPQATGANPAFFAQLGQQPNSQTMLQAPQATGYPPQSQAQQLPANPRQRPQPPPTVNQGSLLPPPPPQRPLSAPNNLPQPNTFGSAPLHPQLTGLPSSQIAPPGHSLAELNQQRMQQQQQQSQPTGYSSQTPGFGNQLAPQQTGFPSQQPFVQMQQPFLGGQQLGGAFPPSTTGSQQHSFQAITTQPTGYPSLSQQPIPTGSINSSLPPALQPQPTGLNGPGANTSFTPSPPPIPHQPTAAPLKPQKTGPAPPVRFGVRQDTNKLTPQATGRRANLSQATPSNPFGF